MSQSFQVRDPGTEGFRLRDDSASRRWIIVTLCALCASALPAFPEQPATARGVVVDAQGFPVSGATVWAVRVELVPIGPRQVESGSDGAFEISLEEGRWAIRARFGGQVGTIDEPYGLLRVNAGQVRQDLQIQLEPGTRLYGTILDEATREPISNASLWLDEGVLVPADGRGRFEYEAVARKNHYLYVIAPGYARKRVLFDTTLRESAGLDIRVRQGGAIFGTVHDTEGNPIANARVWDAGSGNTVALQARVAETDADGRFELEGMGFNRVHRIETSAAGFEEARVPVSPLTLDDPKHTIRFVLNAENAPTGGDRTDQTNGVLHRPRRSVSGVVLRADGTPAAGATVRWISNALDAKRVTTTTGADGSFRLENILDIQSMIMVVAEGHAAAFVPLKTGVTEAVRVTLQPEQVISGRVINSAGDPIAGVRVIPRMNFSLENVRDTKWFSELSAATDQKGRFVLTRQPSEDVTFDFLRAGMSDERRRMLDPGADNVVTMIGGGAIRGKVLGPDGQPLTDYRILVQPTNTPMPGKKSGSMFAGYTGIGIHFSNPDGEFVVSDLTADRAHRLVAVADGYSDAVQDPVLSYPLGQLPPADNLVLRVGPPKRLGVRVTDWTSEQPVSGARIQLVDQNPKFRFTWGYDDQGWERWIETATRADGQGVFSSTGMRDGTLLVRANGYGRRRLPWDGTDHVEVALERESVVQGIAADANGRILAEGLVRLEDYDKNSYSTTLSPADAGHFAFRELPAGAYSLTISRDNQTLFTKDFDLGPGEVYQLDVDSLAVIRRASTPLVIPEPPEPLEIGQLAPPFEAEGLDGGEVRLEDYRGKYVLLDFWATWCGPCIEETPYLKQAYERFEDDDRFVMIGLSLDVQVQDAQNYVDQNGLGWVHAFLGDWSDTPVPDLYRVWGIPSIFLIGPDGEILAQGLRGDAILQAVENALSPR